MSKQEINIDLPETFTSKIIDIIQTKKKESPTEQYVEDGQDDKNQEVEEQSEEIVLPRTKNNCKKSGKKKENEVLKSSLKSKELKREKKLKEDDEEEDSEYINQSSEQIEETPSNTPKKGRPSLNKNSQNKQIPKQYQMFKDYFQEFFIKIIKKLQTHTNSKLNQLHQKIEDLEDKIELKLCSGSGSVREKKSKKFYDDEEFSGKKSSSKRHKYIKTWLKLEYVDKIERKLISIRQASKQLKIKESSIQNWIANKDKLLAIDNQKKGKKIFRDELDSDMLDIE